ncbi:unnamed protein product [Ceratitis capitata]|uniref:(Mediterranean fruit fly) hypothetical protein n=1 Tax=Ceratitis capitata TaxID=7213 RepID=A0A811U635_CERCA|nr:unnamed protein product [Ceratitis capitata]
MNDIRQSTDGRHSGAPGHGTAKRRATVDDVAGGWLAGRVDAGADGGGSGSGGGSGKCGCCEWHASRKLKCWWLVPGDDYSTFIQITFDRIYQLFLPTTITATTKTTTTCGILTRRNLHLKCDNITNSIM